MQPVAEMGCIRPSPDERFPIPKHNRPSWRGPRWPQELLICSTPHNGHLVRGDVGVSISFSQAVAQ